MNFYNAGAVDPFEMDCISMHKRVKRNPCNHLEKHTPLMTQTSCGLKTMAQTNVKTFECSFVYITFVSRIFAPKHSLIVFMPDLCANFI